NRITTYNDYIYRTLPAQQLFPIQHTSPEFKWFSNLFDTKNDIINELSSIKRNISQHQTLNIYTDGSALNICKESSSMGIGWVVIFQNNSCLNTFKGQTT